MDLYRLVIADDEWMIRKGLVNHINWEELGFKVVGDFIDGQYVIEYLQNNEVDVVFVDVQMCQVSGLEVARWIKEQKLPVKVVMISGYKEFDYIKEAMKWGVCDYILKPINENEIKQVFLRMKEELDRQECLEETLISYQKDAASLEAMKAEGVFVKGLMSGNDAEFTKTHHEWRKAVEQASSKYVPLLVFHIIDTINSHFQQEGIHITVSMNQETILEQEGGLQTFSEEIKKIFQIIKNHKNADKDDVIELAKAYIEEHLSERIGVNELADYVYLNPSYFSRKFKNTTGETVADYILNKRMEKAMMLIKEGKYSTGKIAAILGYTEIKYFQRVFKKYTGYTIKEYRRVEQAIRED